MGQDKSGLLVLWVLLAPKANLVRTAKTVLWVLRVLLVTTEPLENRALSVLQGHKETLDPKVPLAPLVKRVRLVPLVQWALLARRVNQERLGSLVKTELSDLLALKALWVLRAQKVLTALA